MSSNDEALMVRVSERMPAIYREVIDLVTVAAQEKVPSMLMVFTSPRATYVFNCGEAAAIGGLEAILDRWAHPDDPSYGRVPFDQSNNAARNIALGARFIARTTEDILTRHGVEGVAFALMLMTEPSASIMSSGARADMEPALRQVLETLRKNAPHIPAHKFREVN